MVLRRGVRSALAPLAALAALAVLAAMAAMAALGVPGAAAAARTAQVLGHPAPAGTGALEAVACATPSTCWAVGAMPVGRQTPSSGGATVVLARTTDAGARWGTVRVHTRAPVELTAVSCPDRRHCTAVGATSLQGLPVGAVLTTADGGRTWTPLPAPASSVDLAGVACRTALACVALATDGTTYWAATTTDGGRIWQRAGDLPAGFGGAGGLTCPRPGLCLVAGYTAVAPGKGAGAVAVSNDGGAAWKVATLPAGTGLLHTVACLRAGPCLAAGTTSTTDTDLLPAPGALLTSSDGGATFEARRSPPAMDDAFGLACTGPARCVLVGTVWTSDTDPVPTGSVLLTDDGGLHWRHVASRFVPVGLIGVACPTPTACVAAGNDVVAQVALPPPPPTARTAGSGSPASTRR